uniref:Uncharacterized protein n=1 Tax=Chryseobacterium endophyticum TaxID=1854762 RepID=A0AAU6WP21_9FLAO
MKKLSVLFCFIFSVFAFSQSDIYFGKKKLVSAEIILENGTAKKDFSRISSPRDFIIPICNPLAVLRNY